MALVMSRAHYETTQRWRLECSRSSSAANK